MAISDKDHQNLYSDLRSALLARHFAFSRYHRANYLSLFNELGRLHNPDSQTPDDKDDKTLTTCVKNVRPPVTIDDYTRWLVADHERENPLLYGAQLFTCLAVEYLISQSTDTLAILKEGIESIGSLYKFRSDSNPHMHGYIIRWDPVTSDHWTTDLDEYGQQRPAVACDFPLGHQQEYLYCVPFNHPEYVPFDHAPYEAENLRNPGERTTFINNDPAKDDEPESEQKRSRLASLDRFRRWEPSQDEIVGLVATYAVVHELVDDDELRAVIHTQVSELADYLAEHHYLLVRPYGGLTARGASGFLSVLDEPFSRVFHRITGNRFEKRGSFEDALDKAGLWETLKPHMQLGGVLGAVFGGIAWPVIWPFVGWAAAGLFNNAWWLAKSAAIPGFGFYAGYIAGRALAMTNANTAFDVWDSGGRGEVTLGYVLDKLVSFTDALYALRYGKSHARNFPPYLALASLHDPSSELVDSFLGLWNSERAFDSLLKSERAVKDPTEGLWTLWATAVAALYGDSNALAELKQRLDDTYLHLSSGKPSIQDDSEVVRGYVYKPPSIEALEYLGSLSLAWLIGQRSPATSTGYSLPKRPSPSQLWPAPVVPAAVVSGGEVPAVASQAPSGGELSPDYLPFSSGLLVKKDSVPPPRIPKVLRQESYNFTVAEAESFVNPNIHVGAWEPVQIVATGEIWAGVWFTGNNGPEGWNRAENDHKFFVTGSQGRPFGLLYQFSDRPGSSETSGWVFCGARAGYCIGTSHDLAFRINDDLPGNGSGQFNVTVTIGRVT